MPDRTYNLQILVELKQQLDQGLQAIQSGLKSVETAATNASRPTENLTKVFAATEQRAAALKRTLDSLAGAKLPSFEAATGQPMPVERAPRRRTVAVAQPGAEVETFQRKVSETLAASERKVGQEGVQGAQGLKTMKGALDAAAGSAARLDDELTGHSVVRSLQEMLEMSNAASVSTQELGFSERGLRLALEATSKEIAVHLTLLTNLARIHEQGLKRGPKGLYFWESHAMAERGFEQGTLWDRFPVTPRFRDVGQLGFQREHVPTVRPDPEYAIEPSYGAMIAGIPKVPPEQLLLLDSYKGEWASLTEVMRHFQQIAPGVYKANERFTNELADAEARVRKTTDVFEQAMQLEAQAQSHGGKYVPSGIGQAKLARDKAAFDLQELHEEMRGHQERTQAGLQRAFHQVRLPEALAAGKAGDLGTLKAWVEQATVLDAKLQRLTTPRPPAIPYGRELSKVMLAPKQEELFRVPGGQLQAEQTALAQRMAGVTKATKEAGAGARLSKGEMDELAYSMYFAERAAEQLELELTGHSVDTALEAVRKAAADTRNTIKALTTALAEQVEVATALASILPRLEKMEAQLTKSEKGAAKQIAAAIPGPLGEKVQAGFKQGQITPQEITGPALEGTIQAPGTEAVVARLRAQIEEYNALATTAEQTQGKLQALTQSIAANGEVFLRAAPDLEQFTTVLKAMETVTGGVKQVPVEAWEAELKRRAAEAKATSAAVLEEVKNVDALSLTTEEHAGVLHAEAQANKEVAKEIGVTTGEYRKAAQARGELVGEAGIGEVRAATSVQRGADIAVIKDRTRAIIQETNAEVIAGDANLTRAAQIDREQAAIRELSAISGVSVSSIRKSIAEGQRDAKVRLDDTVALDAETRAMEKQGAAAIALIQRAQREREAVMALAEARGVDTAALMREFKSRGLMPATTRLEAGVQARTLAPRAIGGLAGGLLSQAFYTSGIPVNLGFAFQSTLNALAASAGGAALALTAAGAAIIGLERAAKAGLTLGEFGRDMENLSHRTNLANADIQAMLISTKRFGVQTHELITGMRWFNQEVAKNSPLLAALGAGTGTVQERLLKVADAFRDSADDAAKAEIAMKLLSRAGPAMIPWLERGGDAIRQNNEMLKAMGATYGREVTPVMKEMLKVGQDSQNRFAAMGVAIQTGLLPVLEGAVVTWNNFARTLTLVVMGLEELKQALPGVGDALNALGGGDQFKDLLEALERWERGRALERETKQIVKLQFQVDDANADVTKAQAELDRAMRGRTFQLPIPGAPSVARAGGAFDIEKASEHLLATRQVAETLTDRLKDGEEQAKATAKALGEIGKSPREQLREVVEDIAKLGGKEIGPELRERLRQVLELNKAAGMRPGDGMIQWGAEVIGLLTEAENRAEALAKTVADFQSRVRLQAVPPEARAQLDRIIQARLQQPPPASFVKGLEATMPLALAPQYRTMIINRRWMAQGLQDASAAAASLAKNLDDVDQSDLVSGRIQGVVSFRDGVQQLRERTAADVAEQKNLNAAVAMFKSHLKEGIDPAITALENYAGTLKGLEDPQAKLQFMSKVVADSFKDVKTGTDEMTAAWEAYQRALRRGVGRITGAEPEAEISKRGAVIEAQATIKATGGTAQGTSDALETLARRYVEINLGAEEMARLSPKELLAELGKAATDSAKDLRDMVDAYDQMRVSILRAGAATTEADRVTREFMKTPMKQEDIQRSGAKMREALGLPETAAGIAKSEQELVRGTEEWKRSIGEAIRESRKVSQLSPEMAKFNTELLNVAASGKPLDEQVITRLVDMAEKLGIATSDAEALRDVLQGLETARQDLKEIEIGGREQRPRHLAGEAPAVFRDIETQQRMWDEMKERSDSLRDHFLALQSEILTTSQVMSEAVRGLADALTDAFSTAFDALIHKTQNAAQAIGNIIRELISSVAKMAIKNAILEILVAVAKHTDKGKERPGEGEQEKPKTAPEKVEGFITRTLLGKLGLDTKAQQVRDLFCRNIIVGGGAKVGGAGGTVGAGALGGGAADDFGIVTNTLAGFATGGPLGAFASLLGGVQSAGAVPNLPGAGGASMVVKGDLFVRDLYVKGGSGDKQSKGLFGDVVSAIGKFFPGGEKKGKGVLTAQGGLIHGPGSDTSDTIPAMLSPGEFVVPAARVREPGVLNLLETLRHGDAMANRVIKMQAGGLVPYRPGEGSIRQLTAGLPPSSLGDRFAIHVAAPQGREPLGGGYNNVNVTINALDLGTSLDRLRSPFGSLRQAFAAEYERGRI